MLSSVKEERTLFLWCAVPILVEYSLNFVLKDCTSTLALIPANTLITHTFVWNLASSSFYESNPLKAGFDVIMLWWISKHVGAPSLEQFGLYFAFSILACSIGTSVLSFLRFVSSGHEYPLISPSYGFGGVLIALMMFARQKLHNQPVHHRFLQFFTYNNVPTVYCGLQLVLALIGLKSFTQDLSFTFISLVFSWSYLKFYYKYNEIDPPGDRSEDFTFVGMFPEAFYIVIVPFTTAFYNLMALLNVFPPLDLSDRRPHHHLRQLPSSQQAQSQSTTEQKKGTETAPLSKADIVAERRRARAMKILDAKMAELAKEPEGWDDVGADAEIMEEGHATTELSKYKI